MNTDTIAQKIFQLRESKAMSQAELAEKADLSVSLISKIERGQVPKLSVDSLERITSALNISLATFFNFDNSYDIQINELTNLLESISDSEQRDLAVDALIKLSRLIVDNKKK